MMDDSFNLILLDGLHDQAEVDTLCKTCNPVWPADLLCMHLIKRQDRANINQAEGTMLNKIGNTFSVLVGSNSTLVDTMNTLFNYAGAFDF